VSGARHRWHGELVDLTLTRAEFEALLKVAVNGIASADEEDLKAIGLERWQQRAAAGRAFGVLLAAEDEIRDGTSTVRRHAP
jgi:hypothetical protein